MAMFFTIVIISLTRLFPQVLEAQMSELQPYWSYECNSPDQCFIRAFLGYNPVNAILNAIPQSVVDTIDPETIKVLTGTTWFPTTLAQAFMPSLRLSFYFGAILSIIATFFSVMRGPKHADRISKVEDRNPLDKRK